MISYIFTLLIFQLAVATYEPFESFGLLTVTHSRKGDFSVIQKYLKRYTQTQCYTDIISEINIVWNNQEPPQSTKIMQRKKHWKIPVYFFRTTFNSMDHRYRLPKQSTAQLLYSLDDDIIVDCQTFKTTLARYNSVNKQTQLGRVTTNQVRAHAFDPNKGLEFSYQGHPSAIYYSIAEPGAAFIPRHFLQLYYLALEQIQYLHDIVLDVKNCDDIFFWALVQHFYPQLPGVYVKGHKNYKNTDPKVGQSKVKNVYQIRHRCINNISEALGYNSLRHFHKNSSKYLNTWQYPNLDIILTQKIAGLNGVDSVRAKQKDKVQEKDENEWQNAKQQIQQDKQEKKKEKRYNEVFEEKQQTHQINKKPKQIKKEMINKQKQLEKHERKQKIPSLNKPGAQKQSSQLLKQIIQTQSNLTFTEKIVLLIAIIAILLFTIYKAHQKYNQTSRFYTQKIADYQEETFTSSIKLPDHY